MIQVKTDVETVQYAEATTWHVDDYGILHVIAKGEENPAVATYAKGHWLSVVREERKP